MDERTEHLVNLFEKMGNCPTIEAERANYDEIFAMLESEGNTDGIEALKATFGYRLFQLQETMENDPSIQRAKQALENTSNFLARVIFHYWE